MPSQAEPPQNQVLVLRLHAKLGELEVSTIKLNSAF